MSSHVAAVDLNDIYVSVVRLDFVHLTCIDFSMSWLNSNLKYMWSGSLSVVSTRGLAHSCLQMEALC